MHIMKSSVVGGFMPMKLSHYYLIINNEKIIMLFIALLWSESQT